MAGLLAALVLAQIPLALFGPLSLTAYAVAPAITSLLPNSGPSSGRSAVTITGSGFTGATAVMFGTQSATSFTFVSDTQINASTPAVAAGTVGVTVTAGGGTSATSSATNFTFLPVALQLNPSSDPPAPTAPTATAVTVSTATLPAATYTVTYTYVTASAEGGSSPASAPVMVSPGVGIQISALSGIPAAVISVKFYLSGGASGNGLASTQTPVSGAIPQFNITAPGTGALTPSDRGNCPVPFSSGFTGLGGFGQTPKLEHRSVNLASFANHRVRVRFFFDTMDKLYNKFEGWYVDNIKVSDPALGQIFFDDVEPGTNPLGWAATGFQTPPGTSAGTVTAVPSASLGVSAGNPGWHITMRRFAPGFGLGSTAGHSWWYGNETTPFTFQGPNASTDCSDTRNFGTLVSPTMLLGSNSALEFDTWWQIESVNPSTFDLMQVLIEDLGPPVLTGVAQCTTITLPSPGTPVANVLPSATVVASSGGVVVAPSPGATPGSITASPSDGSYSLVGFVANTTYSIRYTGFVGTTKFSCGVNVTTDSLGGGTVPVPAPIRVPPHGTWLSALPINVNPIDPAFSDDVPAGHSRWYRINAAAQSRLSVDVTNVTGAPVALVGYRDLRDRATQLNALTGLLAFLSAASGTAPITSLPVANLAVAVAAGATLQLVSGSTTQGGITVAAPGAGVGATSIPVNSFTPNFNYPTGTPIFTISTLTSVQLLNALTLRDIGADEIGPDEIGPDEIGPGTTVDADEIGPDEIGPDEIGPDEIGPGSSDLLTFGPVYGAVQPPAGLAISAHPGLAPQSITLSTRYSGNYYFRVRKSVKDLSSSDAQFQIQFQVVTAPSCVPTSGPPAPLVTYPPSTSGSAVQTGKTTLVLTHTARLGLVDTVGNPAATNFINQIQTTLGTSAAVVDLAADSGLAPAFTDWDNFKTCVAQANKTADSIKQLVTNYRDPTKNPNLQFLAIVGGNSVIPDHLGRDLVQQPLPSEHQYNPGLNPLTSANAALAENYFPVQDFYGAANPILRYGRELWLSDLGIGRVEGSLASIQQYLSRYASPTVSGQVPASKIGSALTTASAFWNSTLSDAETAELTAAGVTVAQQTDAGVSLVNHGPSPPTLTTLTVASGTAPITSLSVAGLTFPVPALATLQLTSGSNTQFGITVAAGGAAVGATSIPVTSFTPNFNYPFGTVVSQTVWTADDLRQQLTTSSARYGTVFLNGHGSAARLLAADNATRLLASDIAGITDHRLDGSLIPSLGCHVGYNLQTFDTQQPSGGSDLLAGALTPTPSWSDAFIGQGANLIAGPLYNYADTQVLKDTALLLDYFMNELRFTADVNGTAYPGGVVPVGKALRNAKLRYISELAGVRPVDEKVLALSDIGFPTFGVNLPGGRLARPGLTPVSTTAGVTSGLSTNDLSRTFTLAPVTTPNGSYFVDTAAPQAGDLTPQGFTLTAPFQPIVPALSQSVQGTLGGTPTLARGAVFLEGDYSQVQPFTPLTSLLVTEVPGTRPPFFSRVFTPWPVTLNEYSGQRLTTIPFNYSSDDTGLSGTARPYSRVKTRVYYSQRTDSTVLVGPPIIRDVAISKNTDGTAHTEVTISFRSSVGVEAVWATFTATSGPLLGLWRSVAMPIKSGTSDIADGQGFLRTFAADIDPASSTGIPPATATRDPLSLRVLFQAVSGTGLVSRATNRGEYYRVVVDNTTATNPKTTTVLTFSPAPPSSASYRSRITVSALLADSSGNPIKGKTVTFKLESASAQAVTGDGTSGTTAGLATAQLSVEAQPCSTSTSTPCSTPYRLTAGFLPSPTDPANLLPAGTRSDISVTPGPTLFALTLPTAPIPRYSNSAAIATLQLSAGGQALNEEPVLIDLGITGGPLVTLTDGLGQVRLDTLDFGGVAPGTYNVKLTFGGDRWYGAATAGAPAGQPGAFTITVSPELSSPVFNPTPQAAGTSVVLSSQVTQALDGSLGDITKAVVNYMLVSDTATGTVACPAPATTTGVFCTTATTVSNGASNFAPTGTASTTMSLPPAVYTVFTTVGGCPAGLCGFFTSPTTIDIFAVFDPTHFATGGGFIITPTGTTLTPPSGTATPVGGMKANFGFNLKYLSGTTTPAGSVLFHINGANVDFKATAFDWLVIASGARAELEGSGTLMINGAAVPCNGACKFHVIAVIPSSGSPTFAIALWNSNTGSFQSPDILNIPGQPLGGGNIVIH